MLHQLVTIVAIRNRVKIGIVRALGLCDLNGPLIGIEQSEILVSLLMASVKRK